MNDVYAPLTLRASMDIRLDANETIIAAAPGLTAPAPSLVNTIPAPTLSVGTRLGDGDCPADMQVESILTLPPQDQGHCGTGYLLRALRAMHLTPGEHEFSAVRNGMSAAIIILSDKGAAGQRQDECAPIISEMLDEALEVTHIAPHIIPDDPARLKALLTDLCRTQRFDLVLTSGGTGVAPRDLTPEATMAVIDKRLPGYERAMTNSSLAVTPHGAISRAVAGTLGPAVVVNLPGSPKAVRENLQPLLPTLTHTIKKLQGDPEDCAKPS